jgi:CBS domain-containing protein
MDITPLRKDDFLTFQDGMTISEALGQLRQFDKRAGLIFRKKKYLGLIERKKLLKVNISSRDMKISKFVQKTSLIPHDADIIEAAAALYDADSDYLPVQKEKSVVGVVYALDVARAALEMEQIAATDVANIRLVKPAKVERHEPVSTVIEIMRSERVDHVPVFDNGLLFGIISFRDLIRKYFNWSPRRDTSARFNSEMRSRGASVDVTSLGGLPVHNFSTNEGLVKIKKGQTMVDAVGMLTTHNIRNLLVVEGQQYLGLLTVRNILRDIGNSTQQEAYSVRYVGLRKNAMKLQRKVKEQFTITIHLRTLRKKGTQQEYHVGLKVNLNGQFISSEKTDWDLEKALHKCFNSLKAVR